MLPRILPQSQSIYSDGGLSKVRDNNLPEKPFTSLDSNMSPAENNQYPVPPGTVSDMSTASFPLGSSPNTRKQKNTGGTFYQTVDLCPEGKPTARKKKKEKDSIDDGAQNAKRSTACKRNC